MKKFFLISTFFLGVSSIFLSRMFSFDLGDLFSADELKEFNRAMGEMFSPEPAKSSYQPARHYQSNEKTASKNEKKIEQPQDEKTLFLNDLKEKEDQVSTALKKAYNTYMDKIAGLLKSIETKSSELLPEVIVGYANAINPILTVHGELKEQDENLALFFSAKMNKVRQQLFSALDPLTKLDQELDGLLVLKRERDAKNKEELKKLADEKQPVFTPDLQVRDKKRMSGLRSGKKSNEEKVTDSEEKEVQLIETEAPENKDQQESKEKKESVS